MRYFLRFSRRSPSFMFSPLGKSRTTRTSAAAGAYLICFCGAAYSGPLWLQILFSLAVGTLIALLFRVAHDAGHGSHFANVRLDRLTCRLSLLPSYHPHSIWLLLHNGRH